MKIKQLIERIEEASRITGTGITLRSVDDREDISNSDYTDNDNKKSDGGVLGKKFDFVSDTGIKWEVSNKHFEFTRGYNGRNPFMLYGVDPGVETLQKKRVLKWVATSDMHALKKMTFEEIKEKMKELKAKYGVMNLL